MGKYVIALNQGTTGPRCILFGHEGDIYSMAQRKFTQTYPRPGQMEYGPMEIWSSQLGVMVEAIGGIGAHISEMAAIGITNQRETTIIWDKQTEAPIHNTIVRQCRRTSDMIGKLEADDMEQLVRERTGLIPDACFSGSKIAWMLDRVEEARKRAKRGELLFGTMDTWLIWNLIRGAMHVMDYTSASRTTLYGIHKLYQDKEILNYFDIPACMLPEAKPPSCLFGYTSEEVIGRRVPIAGVAGDQQVVPFGQCCLEAGKMKNTYGIGCFLLMSAGEKAVVSENGLLTTIAASYGGQVEYALESSMFVAGASTQWLRDELRIIKMAAQSEEYYSSMDDTAGVYIVPAFAGLGALYWHQYARGTIVGLTRGASKRHFARTTVESLVYQVHDLLETMQKDSGTELHALKVDDGASASNFLMQFQSDILDTTMIRLQCIGATALDVAYLVGLAVGYWEDRGDIRKDWEIDQRFRLKITAERRAELVKDQKRAIRRAPFWAENEDKDEV